MPPPSAPVPHAFGTRGIYAQGSERLRGHGRGVRAGRARPRTRRRARRGGPRSSEAMSSLSATTTRAAQLPDRPRRNPRPAGRRGVAGHLAPLRRHARCDARALPDVRGAAVLAPVNCLASVCSIPKMGACGSLFNLCSDPRLNHEIEVTRGVSAGPAGALLRDFFANRRAPSANLPAGGMREWPNRAVSKTVVSVRAPWVRIPLPPPLSESQCSSWSGWVFSVRSLRHRISLIQTLRRDGVHIMCQQAGGRSLPFIPPDGLRPSRS